VAGVAHRTPVFTSRQLDEACGARVFLKGEHLQRMGAFKFRGAWNLISPLPPEVRARGVIAYSSGNHAQAVALVARELGIPSVIVMPSTAPAPKIAATRAYGAEIVHHDQVGESREALAERIARDRGLVLVPPFDHPEIVVGQATAAAELFEDAGPLDAVVAPVGGGGLLSGTAVAASVMCPACRVWGAEPAGADDAVRSLASGRLERCERPDTIADGARTPSLSPLTFALIRRHVAGIVAVPDHETLAAMRFVWERAKQLVEPTGALGVAALLAGRLDLRGARVGVILSGGNTDLAHVSGLLAGGAR
jgi:threonine dehydratase